MHAVTSSAEVTERTVPALSTYRNPTHSLILSIHTVPLHCSGRDQTIIDATHWLTEVDDRRLARSITMLCNAKSVVPYLDSPQFYPESTIYVRA